MSVECELRWYLQSVNTCNERTCSQEVPTITQCHTPDLLDSGYGFNTRNVYAADPVEAQYLDNSF